MPEQGEILVRAFFIFMGFLTSGQTVEQQQANQANFQLGMTIGTDQIRQQQAATNALKQVQMANDAEEKRQLAVRAETDRERKYEADQKLEGVKTKSGADFTRYIAKAGIDNITRSGDTLIRGFQQFSKHPEIYDPATVAGYNQAELAVGAVLGKAQGAIGMLKPGDGFDISSYTAGLGSIPLPEVKYSQWYLDNIESKTYKNNAAGDKLERSGTAGSSTKTLSNWVGAIGGYNSAKNTLTDSMKYMDQRHIDEAHQKGINPFSPQQTALDTYKNSATKFGSIAAQELQSDPGDAGAVYRNLIKKGIRPFDPEQIDRVGSELYNIYDKVAKTDEDKAAIMRFAPMFTGKPLDAFKPAEVTPGWHGGGWGVPSVYVAPGTNAAPASASAPPPVMGMTPDTTDETEQEVQQ